MCVKHTKMHASDERKSRWHVMWIHNFYDFDAINAAIGGKQSAGINDLWKEKVPPVIFPSIFKESNNCMKAA